MTTKVLMEERILTLHPEGKKGVNILRRKYDQIAGAIIEIVKEHEEIAFQDITEKAIRKLNGRFEGKITWYLVSVKLDLEARGILERIPGTSPHRLRLKKQD